MSCLLGGSATPGAGPCGLFPSPFPACRSEAWEWGWERHVRPLPLRGHQCLVQAEAGFRGALCKHLRLSAGHRRATLRPGSHFWGWGGQGVPQALLGGPGLPLCWTGCTYSQQTRCWQTLGKKQETASEKGGLWLHHQPPVATATAGAQSGSRGDAMTPGRGLQGRGLHTPRASLNSRWLLCCLQVYVLLLPCRREHQMYAVLPGVQV